MPFEVNLIQNNVLFISRYTSKNANGKENKDESCRDDEFSKSDKNNLISEVTKGKYTYCIWQNDKTLRKLKIEYT